jgi:hypothetical protein
VAATATLGAGSRRVLVDALVKAVEQNDDSLPEAVRLRLAVDAAKSAELPHDCRLSAGRAALDLGDASVLPLVWKDRERDAPLGHEEAFERCLDLAACGDAAYFETVRAAFPGRGDRRSLKAFALFGTPDDIPRLESAGWIEDVVRPAVAAIRARHASDAGGGPT